MKLKYLLAIYMLLVSCEQEGPKRVDKSSSTEVLDDFRISFKDRKIYFAEVQGGVGNTDVTPLSADESRELFALMKVFVQGEFMEVPYRDAWVEIDLYEEDRKTRGGGPGEVREEFRVGLYNDNFRICIMRQAGRSGTGKFAKIVLSSKSSDTEDLHDMLRKVFTVRGLQYRIE